MTRWTADNTEGFTVAELNILNVTQARLEARYPDLDPKNIGDAINNEWQTGMDVTALTLAAGTRLNREDGST